MAAGKVSFELVAPERVLARAEVDMVVIPGAEGDFGVLPEHAPLLSLLRRAWRHGHTRERSADRAFGPQYWSAAVEPSRIALRALPG